MIKHAFSPAVVSKKTHDEGMMEQGDFELVFRVICILSTVSPWAGRRVSELAGWETRRRRWMDRYLEEKLTSATDILQLSGLGSVSVSLSMSDSLEIRVERCKRSELDEIRKKERGLKYPQPVLTTPSIPLQF